MVSETEEVVCINLASGHHLRNRMQSLYYIFNPSQDGAHLSFVRLVFSGAPATTRYIHVYTYIVHVHAHIYMFIFICTHTHMCVCVHINVCVRVRVCTR